MEFKFFHLNQKEESDFLGILWRTHTGREIPIRWLTTTHIHNIINCINGNGELRIPDPYLGRYHYEWLEIFRGELNLRDAENC